MSDLIHADVQAASGSSSAASGITTGAPGATRSSSPRGEALATCAFGGHAIFWAVEAADESQALGLLPYFVAERATAIRVREVRIP